MTQPGSLDLDPGLDGKPMNSWCISFETECMLARCIVSSHMNMQTMIGAGIKGTSGGPIHCILTPDCPLKLFYYLGLMRFQAHDFRNCMLSHVLE